MQFKSWIQMGATASLWALLAISPVEAKEPICDVSQTDALGPGEWIAGWIDTGDECGTFQTQSIFEPGPASAKIDKGGKDAKGSIGAKSAGGMTYYIMQSYEAPAPAFVNCEDMGGGFLCEAFPQSDDGVTYTWSTTGRVYQPYPNNPSAPAKTLSCNGMGGGGSVTVTVHSPYGVTASATRNLYCGW